MSYSAKNIEVLKGLEPVRLDRVCILEIQGEADSTIWYRSS